MLSVSPLNSNMVRTLGYDPRPLSRSKFTAIYMSEKVYNERTIKQ